MTQEKATVRLSAEALAQMLAEQDTRSADTIPERGEFIDIVEPPPAPKGDVVDVDLADDPDHEPA